MIFISCTYFKYSSLTDTEDIQKKMSSEQRHAYVFNELHMSFLFLFSVMGALAVVAAIVVFKLQEETRRLLKNPWLKDVRTRKPVELPRLTRGLSAFHVFLSHTWAKGDDQMRIAKLLLEQMMPGVKVFLDKDDLKTGAGAEYIDVSGAVLCFCTDRYHDPAEFDRLPPSPPPLVMTRGHPRRRHVAGTC